jgi:Fur family transcriptional regulator, ferric uptake regulator
MNASFQEKLEQKLQSSGARLTRPRKAILNVIASTEQPLTAMNIFEQARRKAPNLGLVTVYRTIDALESLGLIDRIHGSEDCQTIFRAASGHRHLLSCTDCGRSVYFDGVLAEKEFDRIGREHGFKVTGHLLQLFGLCDACNNMEYNNE